MKKIFALLLSMLLPYQVFAFSVPEYRGYVNDFANVLSIQEEQELEQKIREIESQTTAEIAILTIDSTDGVNIQQYGTTVAETWGVGKDETDNGVLITIAVEDREWRIDIGYGVEGILPDLRTKQIGERHFPLYFRMNDYFMGLLQAVEDMESFLQKDPTIIASYERDEALTSQSEDPFWIYFFGIVGGGICSSVRQFSPKKKKLFWMLYLIFLALLEFLIFLLGFGAVFAVIAWVIFTLFSLFAKVSAQTHGGYRSSSGRSRSSFGSSSRSSFGGGSFGGGGSSGKW